MVENSGDKSSIVIYCCLSLMESKGFTFLGEINVKSLNLQGYIISFKAKWPIYQLFLYTVTPFCLEAEDMDYKHAHLCYGCVGIRGKVFYSQGCSNM